MLKFIGIVLALMPIVLFLRAIFMRSKKTSQAVSEFKKQLDYAVWLILMRGRLFGRKIDLSALVLTVHSLAVIVVPPDLRAHAMVEGGRWPSPGGFLRPDGRPLQRLTFH